MKIIKKKCYYCKKKIEGKGVLAMVKIPEFVDLRKKAFCSEECVKDYRKNKLGTLSRSSCPYCVD